MTVLAQARETVLIERTSWTREVFVVLAASILIALFAPLSIPLPFTPIPLALQPHVCLALGALLGSRRASLAVMAFIVQGMFGFPVFAKGTGVLYLLGPTGGYIFGYLIAAYTTGFIVERLKEYSAAKVFGAMAVGNFLIYAFGYMQLACFVGLQAAILLGVLPFLIGDLLKICLAVRCFKSCCQFLGRST